jgi:hypothetical protein
MGLYDDSAYAVRDEIDAAHAATLDDIVSPGTWGTGAQRRAVAVEARHALVEAGMLEAADSDGMQADVALPEPVRRVVRQLAVEPAAVDRAFCERALADGLSDAEYTEIVGVVARITDLDVFARGIGVPPRTLPPARTGSASRRRPAEAVPELAWVPTVPNWPAGGESARDLYGEAPKPYIVRGLSLVPAELRAHLALEQAQYSRLDKVRDFTYQHHEGLTRPQTEIVAGRISAINACFF